MNLDGIIRWVPGIPGWNAGDPAPTPPAESGDVGLLALIPVAVIVIAFLAGVLYAQRRLTRKARRDR